MGRTDGRTDGLTDGRTDGQGDDYMLPRNFSGSIKIKHKNTCRSRELNPGHLAPKADALPLHHGVN